jgi:PAS domain S-box-containing protein
VNTAPATDPAFPFLCLDILGNVLSRAESPAEVGTYLTAEFQELTGARCVVFLQLRQAPECGLRVFSINPARRAEWAKGPAASKVLEELGKIQQQRFINNRDDPELTTLLLQEGFANSMVVPLMIGTLQVGSLVLLGLPEQDQPLTVHDLLKMLATVVALVIRNAFLFDEQEALIASRTNDLASAVTTLRRSEAMLAESQRMAHLGSWELDLASGQIAWSEETYRIFGLETQQAGVSYELFLECIHPDDRAAVKSTYETSLLQLESGYEIEHRIICRKTGEIRHVLEKCRHERGSSGAVVRSIGMVQDITERKLAQTRMAEQMAELQRWLDATLGRELRVLELKREVNRLLAEAGQPIRYPSAENTEAPTAPGRS